MQPKHIHLYAGPSLFGTRFQHLADRPEALAAQGVRCLPPARRGDITRLLESQPTPGAIGLADGTFHAYPSVGHRELRDALDAGWQVFGLCSMGAIRVSELFHYGMVPWGHVARMYLTDPALADDEVALLHSTEAPYLPLSEPLLHIRAFLRNREHARALTGDEAAQLLSHMKERWYGGRTLAELAKALDEVLGAERAGMLRGDLEAFEPFRLKQQDLTSFLTARPWAYPAAPPRQPG